MDAVREPIAGNPPPVECDCGDCMPIAGHAVLICPECREDFPCDTDHTREYLPDPPEFIEWDD